MRAAKAAEHASARLYTVTELAEELGVTPRALRFYEDKDLITPSRAGTTRVYTKREHARMQLILRGKRLGFSLREIKQFLDLYDVDPTHKEQLRQLLEAVRHRVAELEKTREALTETLVELREIEDQTLRALAKRPTKEA
jgi:DNA-binding transcriptional MerR regulator